MEATGCAPRRLGDPTPYGAPRSYETSGFHGPMYDQAYKSACFKDPTYVQAHPRSRTSQVDPAGGAPPPLTPPVHTTKRTFISIAPNTAESVIEVVIENVIATC